MPSRMTRGTLALACVARARATVHPHQLGEPPSMMGGDIVAWRKQQNASQSSKARCSASRRLSGRMVDQCRLA